MFFQNLQDLSLYNNFTRLEIETVKLHDSYSMFDVCMRSGRRRVDYRPIVVSAAVDVVVSGDVTVTVSFNNTADVE